MKKQKTIYRFCSSCSNCPTAEDAVVEGEKGLLIRDDFGGKVRLSDDQLRDLAAFLAKRIS